jgi:hypothetical protein
LGIWDIKRNFIFVLIDRYDWHDLRGSGLDEMEAGYFMKLPFVNAQEP